MEISTIITALITTILGGGLGSFLTLKAQRKKAEAEADTNELENVEKAIAIWKQMAQDLKIELENSRQESQAFRDKSKQLEDQVEALKKQIKVMTNINRKIMLMLEDIIPEEKLDPIKKTIKKIESDEAIADHSVAVRPV